MKKPIMKAYIEKLGEKDVKGESKAGSLGECQWWWDCK